MVVRKRLNLNGKAVVFVTTTVKEWTPVFSDKECAVLTLNQLSETLEHYSVSLIAYVLMPSHIHLLLGFKQIENLSLVIQSFKRMSSRKLQAIMPNEFTSKFYKDGKFGFWKSRFDDLIISSEKQFRIKIEYIHNNPVKTGLVENLTDYNYSSAADWLLDREGIVPVDKDWKWLREKVN